MQKIQIRKLEPPDISQFLDLIAVMNKTFELNDLKVPNKDYQLRFLANNQTFVFAALLNEEIVGGLVAYVIEQYISEKPLAYIYDLAIAKQHQRKGLGTKLIHSFKKYCQNKGFEEVYVQAEHDDPQVVSFYRKTKPTDEEIAVHFSYRL